MRQTVRTLLGATILAATASGLQAQVGPDFDPSSWRFGPRFDVQGEVQIWNPVMQKIRNGEPIIGGTVRSTDPRSYCAMANSGYDFTWVEMQHEAISWEQVARLWATCPGPAVPGVRVAHESEGNLQMPIDMGALVIFVPTIDTVEEAQRAVDWVYHPPMGRRSSGGGQGPGELWGRVPGGFRATFNDNVVLVLMIETLEGVKNAREIARIPGVDGLFAAAGDLGNFSGYGEGDPEYEMLVTEIVQAAQEAGKIVCGPLRWMGVRPEYSCFQGGTDTGAIVRGARAEIDAARQRWDGMQGGEGARGAAAGQLLAEVNASCTNIVYEADCFSAIRQAATGARNLPGGEQNRVRTRLVEIARANPPLAGRIREIAAEAGLPLPN
jgi:2-keto-3-deoxy-L-rhamnonate aldolase RhmA